VLVSGFGFRASDFKPGGPGFLLLPSTHFGILDEVVGDSDMSDALGEVEMTWIVAPVQMLDAIRQRMAIMSSCPALSDAKIP